MTGKTNETWPGDLWKTGGGATWLGGTYDAETNLIFFGTGNPAPVEQPPASGRQPVLVLHASPSIRRPARSSGTTRPPRTTAGTSTASTSSSPSTTGRQERVGAKADRNGFFYVLDRTNGKFVSRLPVRQEDHLGQGHRRRPAVRSTMPRTARATRRKSADGKKGKAVFAVPSLPRRQEPDADGLQPGHRLFYVPANEWGMDIWNEPVTYKKGAAYLGAGFTIKPLFDDHIGALQGDRPGDRQDRLGSTRTRPRCGAAC